VIQVDQDSLRFILGSAIFAPSADNQHRIRFQLDQNIVRFFYTDAALPPPGGYKRALLLLSLGALAENLVIAASRVGMRVETTLFPDPARPLWIMQTRLQPHPVAVDPLCEFIPLRHTNRRVRFSGPPMTDAERVELEASAQRYPACQLTWLDEPARRGPALKLMRRAETARFRTRPLHEELFSAIRFEAGWRESCPIGLPPGALGVEPPLRPVFSLLRHWPVMRLANLFGAHHMLGWRACDLPSRLAPHRGLLAVKNTDDQSVFDAGRAFQRVWLTVTSQGRVLQPMPASAVFALEGASAEGVPIATQHGLREGWKSILGEAVPLMVFRMGFAKPLPTAAGRPGVEVYADT
jgi:hypothetical protein